MNTEDRRAIIAKTAELNGFKVSVAEFSDFVKSDPYKVLTELYTPTEAEERLKQSFVFFTGDKAFLEVPSGTSTKVTVDLIVLNNKLQPLIASNVSLVVPTGQ